MENCLHQKKRFPRGVIIIAITHANDAAVDGAPNIRAPARHHMLAGLAEV